MSAALYKVIHIAAVLYLFTALGGLMLHAVDRVQTDGGRKLAGLTHGVALLVVLITGFGLVAGLQTGMPLWIWLKLGIWLAIGASLAAIRRMPNQARLLWLVLPLLGAAAAYLAIFKPMG
jgi:hypothetical protein